MFTAFNRRATRARRLAYARALPIPFTGGSTREWGGASEFVSTGP